MPLALLGLPSLHSIIEGIANGFFGALAGALVPGFLKHGTIATIQHLVALPNPGTWGHVGQLQGDMTYLAAMLMPVTLAVGTLRYWLIGLTGQAHPVAAVARCTWVTGVLVAYPWIVEQSVDATNTLTHAILGFPTVGNGLQRIIGVLFGGALLAGAGGVFGAFLVIIGVLFAAGLFAAQVMLTVALALLIVAGPPLIALSAIPELSHLARAWAHALLATALVPLGWTVLFATAGALCLDATSFTGGAAGLPGHVAAAFAGLITFVLAVKLPWILFGEIRRLLTNGSLTGHTARASAPSHAPGVERVKAAHARLRSAAYDGVPSLGRSVGRAAGAMGAPAGGPVGAAHRGLAGAARRAGITPATDAGSLAGAAGRRHTAGRQPQGVRGRLARAGGVLRDAPRDAKEAMASGARNTARASVPFGVSTPGPARKTPALSERQRWAEEARGPSGDAGTQRRGAQSRPRQAGGQSASSRAQGQTRAPQQPPAQRTTSPLTAPKSVPRAHQRGASPGGWAPARAEETAGMAHPGRKITAAADRDAAKPTPAPARSSVARAAKRPDGPKQPRPPRPAAGRTPFSRKPRPPGPP